MKLNIKSALLLTSVLSFGAMGCLKDKAYDDGQIQSTNSRGDVVKVIEIKLDAVSADNFTTWSFGQSDADTTVVNFVPVNLATNEPAAEDINVTVVAKPELVDDYNTANETDYSVPPDNMLTILNPGGIVTIKKGEHTGYLQAKFRINDYLGASWAAGYAITSIDKPGYVISGNLSTGIAAIVVKNPWDGDYTVTGYLSHPSAPRAIKMTKTINTVTAVTSETDLGDLGASNYAFDFDVDGSNNLVNWVAKGATPPAPGSGFIFGADNAAGNADFPAADFNHTQYNNTYDPATHTFWMHYGYNGAAPAFTREVYEKWVLK
jgi:hypothetical protein